MYRIIIVKYKEIKNNKKLNPIIFTPSRINKSFEYKQFGDIIDTITGGATPSLLKIGDDSPYTNDKNEGVPFLRIQNIREEGINYQDIKYIKKDVHNKELKRSQLSKGDIVFTITGRLGTTVIIPQNFIGNINQHSVRIRLKKDVKVKKEYLAIYFNSVIGQSYVFKYSSGGTRAALDYETIKGLNIPIPKIEVQEEIIDIMTVAYNNKFELDRQAENILCSIKKYIIEQLKIYNETPVEKNYNNFLKKISEIKESNRLDPFWFSIEDIFYKSSYYDMKKLKEIVTIKKGQVVNEKSKTGDIPIIAGGTKPAGMFYKYNFSGNIITISASGTAGYVSYHDNPIWASDCNVLESRNNIDIKYVYWILKLQQENIYKIRKGSVIQHVYANDIEQIEIPLPDYDNQKKISCILDRKYNVYIELKNKSMETINKANKSIENILIGNNDNE